MPNRAAVMIALNEIRIEDRAIPEPGPHDAVVRIEAVGVFADPTIHTSSGAESAT